MQPLQLKYKVEETPGCVQQYTRRFSAASIPDAPRLRHRRRASPRGSCGPGAAVRRQEEWIHIYQELLHIPMRERKNVHVCRRPTVYSLFHVFYFLFLAYVHVAWQYAICVARQRSYLLREANASYVGPIPIKILCMHSSFCWQIRTRRHAY